MVNKCSIVGCCTNYDNYDKGTVFPLPEDEEQRKKWIRFLNRKDPELQKTRKQLIKNPQNCFICYKHFADNVLIITPTRVTLNPKMNPVTTIVYTRFSKNCELRSKQSGDSSIYKHSKQLGWRTDPARPSHFSNANISGTTEAKWPKI